MEIKIKPHGNSKSDVPFFRISESAQKFHKELSIRNKPKEVIFLATQKEGGEVEAEECHPYLEIDSKSPIFEGSSTKKMTMFYIV